MIVTFVAPSTSFPTGGAIAIYEFANGLARRGHEIHVVHVDLFGDRIAEVADITWCPFDDRIHHHLPDDPADPPVPDGDAVLCFDGRLPTGGGALAVFVQGYKVLPEAMEDALYHAPCPKICTSRFLQRMVIEHGTALDQAVFVPYGLRHDKYRVTAPIDRRPPRVSMLYNNHPTKCAALGAEALAAARRRIPDLEVVLFGTSPPADGVPADMTFVLSPDQDALVQDIYNTSRVFVSSALYEGFGLAPVEAMACGAALVTTDNGGADDYAVDGVTALVAPPLDVDALATRIVELLDDDDRRQEIAENGRRFVERFTWDVAAEHLERFLVDHLVSGNPAPTGPSVK